MGAIAIFHSEAGKETAERIMSALSSSGHVATLKQLGEDLEAEQKALLIWSGDLDAPETQAKLAILAERAGPNLVVLSTDGGVSPTLAGVRTFQVSDWDGSAAAPLIVDLNAVLGSTRKAEPTPEPPPPAETGADRRPETKPTEHSETKARTKDKKQGKPFEFKFDWKAAVGAISLGGALTAFAFFTDVMSLQKHFCSFGFAQPGLSDLCGAFGLGDRPTRQERQAFEALAPGDCAALRAYRREYETSPLRELADSRLAGRRVRVEETWVETARQFPLYIGSDATARASEQAARDDALRRAAPAAARVCGNLTDASPAFRVRNASVVAETWRCRRSDRGHVCGFEGAAQCQLSERQEIEREICR